MKLIESKLKNMRSNSTHLTIFKIINSGRNQKRNDVYQYFHNNIKSKVNISLQEYKHFLRDLELIGVGNFDKYSSKRFIWNYCSHSISGFVIGKIKSLNVNLIENIEMNKNIIKYKIPLRKSFITEINIPVDLTNNEKKRIFEFLKLVPIMEDLK